MRALRSWKISLNVINLNGEIRFVMIINECIVTRGGEPLSVGLADKQVERRTHTQCKTVCG